jgi:alkanesulfonate monooxygenase SsuD/methylene tetrahydromethanopterin reductase-like flavin-dependent oxidoreductase (luciferase family)
VAAQGYNLLLGQFSPLEQVREGIALFKAEVEAHGRTFDPMSVAVARSLNVVWTAAEYEQAIETRMAGRRRTQRLAQRPNFTDTREAAEAGTLYGTPDVISAKLQELRDAGAEYVLLNSPGGLPSLRCFAQEVMPAFSGPPLLQAAV